MRTLFIRDDSIVIEISHDTIISSIHATEAEIFMHDDVTSSITALLIPGSKSHPFYAHLRGVSVTSIAAGPCIVAFTTNTSLFSIGLNVFNPARHDSEPQLEHIADIPVSSISVGYSHILVMSETLLAVGSDEYGQLGVKTERDTDVQHLNFSATLLSVHISASVVAIASGTYHNALLTSAGEVYTWGLGRYHRLGHSSGNCSIPTLVDDLVGVGDLVDGVSSGIGRIACGTWHTIVATDSSNSCDIYGWGWCKYGQLGHSEEVLLASPTLLDIEVDVRGVYAGATYSAIQTAKGVIILSNKSPSVVTTHECGSIVAVDPYQWGVVAAVK